MNLLYVVVAVLIIVWLLGFSVLGAGSIIHVLLILAIVIILVKVVQGRRL